MIYKLVIGACLSLALKIMLVPDWASVAALFVFALSGLGVYFLERTDFSSVFKEFQDRCNSAILDTDKDVETLVDRLNKLESHVERLDNRTRPSGR